MNIAIGGFFHESNTFNPIITGKEDIVVFEKEEIFTNKSAFIMAKGIIDYFQERGEYSLYPLVFMKAVPNGEINREYYLLLKERFFAYLKEAPQIDAFVLALHGSMRVEGIGSAESDLLADIKKQYPSTPIFSALDMHASITKTMMETADAFVAFKTAPHIDVWETGYKIAELADFSLKNKITLKTAYAKVNCLIAGEKSETDCQPMKSLIDELHQLEKEAEILSASYCLGFPWADAKENGVTAIVVCKTDHERADHAARYLADKFQEKKHLFGFSMPSLPPEQALIEALKQEKKPVFVSDSGDNPTAGSTADNTEIIRLLSRDLKDKINEKSILIAGIFDPLAVALCEKNMQTEIELFVGGIYDTKYCKPVLLQGVPIKRIEGFGLLNTTLILFKTKEFELIICSKHIGFTNSEMFKALGINHLKKDLVIVKLGYLTEEFRDDAAVSFMALSRGCTDEVLSRLDYSYQYELI